MEWLTKLAKKAMGVGGLKALCQQRLHRHRSLLKYQRLSICPPAPRAPAGHLPVYVGEEERRFVIPTSFLSHPLFSILLEKSYQEYGFMHNSGLRLPCNIHVFMYVVSSVEKFHGQFDLSNLTERRF